MHELSIALSIIELVNEKISAEGINKVDAVHLKLGVFAGVVKDALLFSYQLACEGTALTGSQLIIEELPLMIYCENCRSKQILATIQQLSCPICQTPTNDIVQGKELEISALEISS